MTHDNFEITGDTTFDDESREKPQLEIGSHLGRYVIIEQVGEGGMGVVYKAYDPELDRAVAIKLMATSNKPEAEQTQGQASRLLREAQALAQLAHPNIVAIFDAGTHEAGIFLAMEFVQGQTLRQWLSEKSPGQEDIIKTLIEAGKGLAAAHQRGIIHRDFKPDNIIIGQDGRVRILDFGLARASNSQIEEFSSQDQYTSKTHDTSASDSSVDADEAKLTTSSGSLLLSNLTQDGAIAGTPAYMAPEQFAGKAVGEKSDQYSFCAVLYQALYGCRPYDGNSIEEYQTQVLRGNHKTPQSGVNWPWPIIQKGLSTKPNERHKSMERLLDALCDNPDQARRKRLAGLRRMLAAIIVGALVSIAFFVLFNPFNRDLPCLEGKRIRQRILSNALRQKAQDRFFASKLPFAKQTWNNVIKHLKQYLDEWQSANTKACEATLVRGEQSLDLFDRKKLCLSARLDQTQALLEAFASADEKVITHAIQATDDLEQIRACEDSKTLRERKQPPQDELSRRRVAALSRLLARIKISLNTGDEQQAIETAHKAIEKASDIGYLPLLAEAHYYAGVAYQRLGKIDLSYDSLQESWLAAEASGYDKLRVQVTVSLVLLYGIAENKLDQAIQVAKDGQAILDRMGGNPYQQALLKSKLGLVEVSRGKAQQGIVDLMQAYQAFDKTLGSDHYKTITTLILLDEARRLFEKNDQVLGNLHQARERLRNLLGQNHPRLALIGAQIRNLVGPQPTRQK